MSLRKAGSVRVDKSGFLGFIGNRKIFFAKNQYFEIQQYEAEKQQKEHGAAKVGKDGHRVLWWAKSGFYWADGNLTNEEVLLLIWGRENKQKAQIERLREVREFGETVVQTNREMIPQETRAIVWQRDGGQCVQSVREMTYNMTTSFLFQRAAAIRRRIFRYCAVLAIERRAIPSNSEILMQAAVERLLT